MLKQDVLYGNSGSDFIQRLGNNSLRFPRRSAVALILLVALLAFELFNFDTTRFALSSLLGPVTFLGIGWASILAIAFCAIDFAGLVRMFTPESSGEQPKEVWYLMGAWFLGATMNAIMTWWAVSLTLLNHDFGNEVLSRGQLLQAVPIFVATLVWLTRILFIGALTVTGNQLLFSNEDEGKSQDSKSRGLSVPLAERLGRLPGASIDDLQPTMVSRHGLPHVSEEVPAFLRHRVARVDALEETTDGYESKSYRSARNDNPAREVAEAPKQEAPQRTSSNGRANGRVRQRPPMPGANGFHARSRGRN